MKRIRIEDVSQIDFTHPEVIRLLAKGYAVILKDTEKTTGDSKEDKEKD